MGVQNGKATSKEIHGRVQGRNREVDPRERENGGFRSEGTQFDGNRCRNWVKTAESSGSTETLIPDERAELRRLRKENRELRMEKKILRKATAFFAKESR